MTLEIYWYIGLEIIQDAPFLFQEKIAEEKEGASQKESEAKASTDDKSEAKEGADMDTSTSNETPATAGGTSSSMVVGDDYNKMVQNIVDMGYEKSQVDI